VTVIGLKYNVYADGMTNITIQECARLNRHLQEKLDADSEVPEVYTLDVSSPGMSNSLKLPIQYKKRLDKNLKITKTDGVDIEGKIIHVDDEGVEVEVTIPMNKKLKQPERIEKYSLKYNEIKKALIPIKFNKK
jgi:ribosome maturation factor RimP